jgi:hypothetical protein
MDIDMDMGVGIDLGMDVDMDVAVGVDLDLDMDVDIDVVVYVHMEQLFAKGVWNLTHNYPFGSILENMGPSSKPSMKISKNGKFNLDPHFSAWCQKALEPDP